MGDSKSSMMQLSNSIISGGTFIQHNYDQRQYHVHTNAKDPYEKLVETVSSAAFHNSGERYDPPKCHPNTRVAVIQKIIDWIDGSDVDLHNALIMWLSGAAGAGKSAIAQSLAERCFSEGKLLASFFFGRLDPTRNHSRSLVTTIAYQLCSRFPVIRQIVVATIEKDPLIFSRSLLAQFTALVLNPLVQMASTPQNILPRLIIIDGLDECLDIKAQQDIIDAIYKVTQVSDYPILFLVCSRPENQISSAFNTRKMKDVLTRLFLDDNYVAREDIERYLRDHFTEIKSSHTFRRLIPATWPTSETIDTLVRKSSGQFIYATTVVRYVQSARHMPHHRLDALLHLRPSFKDLPFAELDSVYKHIFSTVKDMDTVLEVLALVVVHVGQSAFPVNEMEKFLDLESGYIHVAFFDLGSLVEFREETGLYHNEIPRYLIRFLHASFVDFLLDPKRSGELSFDLPIKHTQQVVRVLKRLTDATRNGQWSNNTSIMSCFTFLHFDQYDIVFSTENKDSIGTYSLPSTFNFLLSQQGPDLAQIGVYITEFLRPLFRLMQISDDEEIRELHRLKMQDFSRFILDQLETHFSDDFEFNFQFFLAHMHPIGYAKLPSDFWSITFQRQTSDLRMNVLEGVILTRFPVYDASDYLAPRKSSWTTIPGPVRKQIYARAALYCFEYLCSCQGDNSTSVSHSNAFRHRKNRRRRQNQKGSSPWIILTLPSVSNKRLIRSQYVSNHPTYKYSNLKYYYLHGFHAHKEKTWSARYPQLLAYLNYFLPHSSRHEMLIQACRQSVFPRRSLDFPSDMRRLRRKMADYLRRV
ncbi:hypothetical protein D9613_008390 [Agrocybe pediades]|uniref:Nephrocystin 3-like N-terminal domain-containing protein n=1 Tax=Agrocybe pediades TaxID=84607 RepID=A0A8H4VN90_9AGAR|nr:hypothetical protein D9613_008390 [Agrocybe pediades]